MKSNFFKRSFYSFLTIASASLILTACDKNDDVNDNGKMYTVSGNASGVQEVPAVITTATGALTGNYNSGTNTLTYNITWTGLSGNATDVHLHGPAAAGVSAGVLLPIAITTNGTTGSSSGSVVIVDSVENAMLLGNVYYNVHTAANSNGEIRGQVTATTN